VSNGEATGEKRKELPASYTPHPVVTMVALGLKREYVGDTVRRGVMIRMGKLKNLNVDAKEDWGRGRFLCAVSRLDPNHNRQS
jgi:hypothetical protein